MGIQRFGSRQNKKLYYERLRKIARTPQTFICYNAIMSNQCKVKCYFCDQDALYTSDHEGLIIDTCEKHFKYKFVG